MNIETVSETKQLEIAVANIALSIAEIINAKTRAASEEMEQKIAMKLVEHWLTRKRLRKIFM